MTTSGSKKLKSAVIWSFIAAWGAQGISMLSVFVMAALLGPSNFGIIAMAAIFVAFIQMFLEQGLSAALIQRKELEPEHLDTVFWMMLLLSALLAVVCIALSEWWAKANRLPALGLVIRVYAVMIPIQGLTVVQLALLQRKLDFRSLAIRTTVAGALGAVLGISLALRYRNVWALVAEDLAAKLIELGLLWRLGDWRPRMRFSMAHLRQLTGFSLQVFSSQLGTFVQRRCDALLIGLFFGPLAVGIYRLADKLVTTLIELVTRPLVSVVLPHFSRLQEDSEGLKRSLLSCIRSSSILTIPMMAILAALATLLCAALGPQWAPAAPVAQLLCLVGTARAVTLFTGPLLQAAGHPKYFARMTWSLAVANFIAFTTAGLVLRHASVSGQTIGMAMSRAGVFCLMYVPVNLWMMMRLCKISGREMAATLRPALLISAVALGVGFTAAYGASQAKLPALLTLLIAGTATGALVGGLMMLVDPKLRDMVMTPLAKFKAMRPAADPAAVSPTAG